MFLFLFQLSEVYAAKKNGTGDGLHRLQTNKQTNKVSEKMKQNFEKCVNKNIRTVILKYFKIIGLKFEKY